MNSGGSTIIRQLLRCLAAATMLSAAASARTEGIDLISADTLSVSGDFRLVGVDGEESWTTEGFGKLRSGSDGDWRARPEPGNFKLVWQPDFGWALSATVVGAFQGGERTEAGISQAYLSYKPLLSDRVRLSARAGLFWPPVSLEHEGADWNVQDTITPSAINSWIGEEVRPAAIEATAAVNAGSHEIMAVAAVFAANDTAGTLLTFRGWALHDRETLAFKRQPLPPLTEAFEYYQPQYSHPLLDVSEGFANRPGYYVKLGWQPPLPVRAELFHYDNRADPEAFNEDNEWGWRTKFNHFGAVAELGAGAELKVQAMKGRTLMGYDEGQGIWVDCRFRSAFALVSKSFGKTHLAARVEAFDTRQHGSLVSSEYEEDGWAATLAARRDFGRHLTGVVELVHVSSRRDQREERDDDELLHAEEYEGLELKARQRQTLFQASLRVRW